MKKILALALCAFMMVAMIASVSAVEYVLDYTFEEDFEGEFIAIDNSIKFYPKQFSATVVKFDNTLCIKMDRTGEEEISGQMDCYCDVLAGGTSAAWGLDGTWVFSYDVYFESLGTEEDPAKWQVGMLRMAAPAGTQFQHSAMIIGNKLWSYDGNADKGAVEVMTIETGKWYNIATVFDMQNKCMSNYVDGVLVNDSIDWNCTDTSATEATQVRCAWGDGGEGLAYVDNFKAYVADKPENATGAKIETTAAPATEAPAETTAAPAETSAAATAAQTTAAPSTGAATATADVAVILAAVSAIAASGAIVLKKKH